MRILHVVKTSDGARWAALQVRELIRAGVEVDVVVPALAGQTMDLWAATGARLHAADLNFPVARPWLLRETLRRARQLVERLRPDAIHSHFVSTTLTLRAAFGRDNSVPRFFQVPGPLHLEHWFYRTGELGCAGPCDYWIASSRYTRDNYLAAGVPGERVFLSYYAVENQFGTATDLRGRLGIGRDAFVVGNINMFYRPKRYLGQFIGIKAHEDVLEALRIVTGARKDVYGVLVGGPWGNAHGYIDGLRKRAEAVAPGRILLPGPLAPKVVLNAWREFDCAVHVPLSENCGGVVEPLLANVPVVAGRVGGLPEVAIEGLTALTVPIRNPGALADAIFEVLANMARFRAMARNGSRLVCEMFSAKRTAAEIKGIYEYVLGKKARRPADFDSDAYARAGESSDASTQACH
jgi:glycosyltransferase involved in cell wall biosynthesis